VRILQLIQAFTLATTLAAISPTMAQAAEPAPKRPNVLFVYTDDQALWTIGAYGRRVELGRYADRPV